MLIRNVPSRDLEQGSVARDVVVVDDDAIVRQGLVITVERLGYSASDFGDQADVVEAILACRPKLVFLDLSLGRRDGIAVMRGLQNQRFEGVIQLMSGWDEATIEEAYAIGVRLGLHMLRPLAKPIAEDVVRGTIESILPAPTLDPSLVFDVSEALAKGWLEVWYQPKINLRRRVLCGAEALLRLRHPTLGILPPSRFIPSSGSTSYDDMTAFVFERVARDWRVLGRLGTRLPVSINASVSLMERPSFLQMLTAAWPTMAGRPPLTIEITEDEVIADLQSAHDAAIQLRLHGAQLSIDDFGTGYSTFSRLRDLPFSEIKLDRSFVLGCAADLKQRALSEAAVGLARQFGMLAVAEGVENKEDCAAVQALGFDAAQGYYFARPVAFAAFRSLIVEKARAPRSHSVVH